MIYKKINTGLLTAALIIATLAVLPAQVHASFNPLNPLDPFCLFSCNNQPPQVTNSYTTTGSYNRDSFNTNTTTGSNSPIIQSGTTGTAYVAPTTPTYTYNQNPPVSYPTVYPTLSVSCYSTPTYADIGETVNWNSSVSGGNGSTYVTWSGTDGLSGTGSSIQKSYSYAGTKSASVTVISGGQTQSVNCAGAVTVANTYNSGGYPTPVYNYNSYPTTYYPPTYTAPVYYQQPTYTYPISVSCSPSTTYTNTGTYVTWTAYVSGGSNYYNTSYTWSGTDGLYGSQSAISTTYNSPGTKYAYVTVYANGQTSTIQCSSAVTVNGNYGYNYNYQYQAPVYPQYGSNPALQIVCAADKTSTSVGVPVTWAVEVLGGGYNSNYTYAWTGTDGLTGYQSSLVRSYSKSGTKSAVVTVTTPNGQSQSKSCSNTVYVKAAAVAVKKAVASTPPQVVVLPPISSQLAGGLFSLQNVPWGWVAVLVILVLIGMISYMLFNKKKI